MIRYPKTLSTLSLVLALSTVTCAGVSIASSKLTKATVTSGDDDTQTQPATTTVQSFTVVEGNDLMSKLEAAQAKARARSTPYWSAYSFDVRPGVAVDASFREFDGTINTLGDTSVMVGTTSNGIIVETRNLAVFLLRDPSANQIIRMEVYNLERKREYAGYPVYWLGRANNEESLNYLRALVSAAPLDNLSERAVLGIALHDDVRVAGMLKNLISTSQNPRIRSSSVYWLGQVGSELGFLASLVSNNAEEPKIRRLAAYSIGRSHDRGTMTTLQQLFDEIKDIEIHRSLVSAAGASDERPAAFTFLSNVAKVDQDLESRKIAVRQLGQFHTEAAADELMRLYSSEANLEVKKSVLRSLVETKSVKAYARVVEIARTDSNIELRKQAVRVLSDRGEAAFEDLLKLYDAEQAPEVKRSALQALGNIKNPRVEEKLFEVARNGEPIDLRRQAIHLLGERVGKRSFEFLSATAQGSDGNAEVQVQAVKAIGERRSDESIALLIKIAKTHPNQQVRKQAVRTLGDSGDPRAIEFFREVLSK